jgi:3-keto-5-aminohexanoate cleavage enzyme
MAGKKKVIVVAAINGGMQKDRDGAKVPISPEEIAEESYNVWKAGASVVHVHARDAEGRNSGDPALFEEIIRLIREKCDILIQTTNGIGIRYDRATGNYIWPRDEERLGLLDLNPRQDLFGIAAGSGDFYNPEGGYKVETPFMNSLDLVRETVKRVHAMGSVVEFETPHAAVLHRLLRVASDGTFDPNQSNLWILHGSGFGNSPSLAHHIVFAIQESRRLFPNSLWGATATGKDMFWVCNLGLSMGCDSVRIGFEDSVYLPDGSVARTNADQVDKIVEIARIWGREPATVAEAREIFQLKT